jgi:hypothetical protein
VFKSLTSFKVLGRKQQLLLKYYLSQKNAYSFGDLLLFPNVTDVACRYLMGFVRNVECCIFENSCYEETVAVTCEQCMLDMTIIRDKNSIARVRERTIPTERPPLVGGGSANFCGLEGATWSA